MPRIHRLSRIITYISGALTCVFVVALPLGYFIISYQHMAGSLETEAEINADIISHVISLNPNIWRYEQIRLEKLLSRRPRLGHAETRRIVGAKNENIAESANVLKPPILMRSFELFDSGVSVGRIEISRSLQSLAMRTGMLALLGLFIGSVVFITLRVLPLRVIYRSEEELRESEERFSAVVQTAADAIISTDASGNIISWNRGAQNIFGYSEEEVLGKPTTILMSEQYRDAHKNGMARLNSTGESNIIGKKIEMAGLRKDGSEFSIDISITRWEVTKGVFYTSIIRDITERKRGEKELIEARHQAEEASRLKSEFLANMSHEIRTPMNGIMGMTSLALDTELTEEQREYLKNVQKSGDALLNVINDILDFSKIEAGKLTINLDDFNLRVTVEDVADILAPKASEKGLEFICTVHHDVPCLLKGDSGRIRQILLNLGGNAIKFTEKGEVVINVEIKEETEDTAFLLFSVFDTGIGIPQDKRRAIFEPFVQADGSTTRHFGGTGLGLSICKKFISLMGGEIEVEGKHGEGSRFWFTLRLEKQDIQNIISDKEYANVRNLKALVVDDNKTNRDVLAKMIGGFGCRSGTAANGADAIKALKEAVQAGDPYSVALLDMQMPGMDGEQTTIIIKNTAEIKDTIVIILTSIGRRGDVARLRDIGCSGYLTKPIKQSLLLDAIIAAINQRSRQGEAKTASSVITRHTITDKKFQHIRILVAEDNQINQKLIVALLKKAGYVNLDIAEDGRKAVEAIEKRDYDIILMDVQMPEMDGFEATKAIRNKEGASKHTTIIAMTAHALKGDRERCLEAGMDDYISKPISPNEMFGIIRRWAKSKIEEPTGEAKNKEALKPDMPVSFPKNEEAEKQSEFPVDIKSAMSRFDNDMEFYKTMLNEFLNYVPEQIKALEEAVKSGDADEVQRHAHSIKGAAGNLSAIKIFSIAKEIEEKGRNGDIEGVIALTEKLKSEISRFEDFSLKLIG